MPVAALFLSMFQLFFPSNSACPQGCLECDSDSLCHLCDSTTFLKNKICVSACGQGFYGNMWTRECEEGECLVIKQLSWQASSRL